MSDEGQVIYRNSYQAFKVRVVFWVLFLIALGTTYWGWQLSKTFGLSPGDGGVLRPAGQRFAVGFLVASIGIVVVGGMWLYCRRYVISIAIEGEAAAIVLMRVFGNRTVRYPLSAFGRQVMHKGQTGTATFLATGLRVDAPWLKLKVKGKWLPYVVDMQAEEADRDALGRLSVQGSSDSGKGDTA